MELEPSRDAATQDEDEEPEGTPQRISTAGRDQRPGQTEADHGDARQRSSPELEKRTQLKKTSRDTDPHREDELLWRSALKNYATWDRINGKAKRFSNERRKESSRPRKEVQLRRPNVLLLNLDRNRTLNRWLGLWRPCQAADTRRAAPPKQARMPSG